jgi:hypothetical protein
MAVDTRLARAASATTSAICAQWLVEETLLERLAQDFEHMPRARGPLIHKQDAVVRQGYLQHEQLAAADHAHIGDRVVGARKGSVVTRAVRSPVRPATLWMRVVSMASARLIAGRMGVSRRASIDVPGPGEQSIGAD